MYVCEPEVVTLPLSSVLPPIFVVKLAALTAPLKAVTPDSVVLEMIFPNGKMFPTAPAKLIFAVPLFKVKF